MHFSEPEKAEEKGGRPGSKGKQAGSPTDGAHSRPDDKRPDATISTTNDGYVGLTDDASNDGSVTIHAAFVNGFLAATSCPTDGLDAWNSSAHGTVNAYGSDGRISNGWSDAITYFVARGTVPVRKKR
jgi:hypothetical protein